MMSSPGNMKKNKSAMFLLYMHVNCITSAKLGAGAGAGAGAGGESAGDLISFTIKDLYAVQEIQKQENVCKMIKK
jgi:DNA helicase MCM8